MVRRGSASSLWPSSGAASDRSHALVPARCHWPLPAIGPSSRFPFSYALTQLTIAVTLGPKSRDSLPRLTPPVIACSTTRSRSANGYALPRPVTFSYDFLNRVVGTQYTTGDNTVSETYGYDTFLRRVQRAHTETFSSVTTSEFYVFHGANLVATIDKTATLKDAYLFAGVDHPLRLSRGGSSYFYEVDLAGNVRRLRDAGGADLGGYRYTAFGAAFGVDPQTPAPAMDQPLR